MCLEIIYTVGLALCHARWWVAKGGGSSKRLQNLSGLLFQGKQNDGVSTLQTGSMRSGTESITSSSISFLFYFLFFVDVASLSVGNIILLHSHFFLQVSGLQIKCNSQRPVVCSSSTRQIIVMQPKNPHVCI
jgi:hypothetical protein